MLREHYLAMPVPQRDERGCVGRAALLGRRVLQRGYSAELLVTMRQVDQMAGSEMNQGQLFG